MKIAAGIILAMSIALSIGGWLLWREIGANSTLRANVKQSDQVIKDLQEDAQKVVREKEAGEVIIADNSELKEVITETHEKIRYVIREVQKEVPATDCLNQPVPDRILECLQSGECN